MANVRISINDLIQACRILGEVRVMAAGSMWATLQTSNHQRSQLTRYEIDWLFD